MKRIIVEGIDGSGKSTLIHRLLSNFPILRAVPGFKKSGELDYGTWLKRQFERGHAAGFEYIPIHDRFFYSELVYGPVLRQELAVTPKLYTDVIEELRLKSLLIYCRVPYSYLLDTITVNEQMEGVIEHLPVLYEEYEHLMMEEAGRYGHRFIVWDFTYMKVKQLLDRIADYVID